MSADAAGGEGRFPRSARLKCPPQFQEVFTLGRRLNGPAFRLHAHLRVPAGAAPETPSLSRRAAAGARLGISVPKRVAAHAVERNRIRRIARESFRLLRPQLPDGDYVLVAVRDAKDAPAATLRSALSSLWKRAGALKPEVGAPTMPIPKPLPAEAPSAIPPSPAVAPEPPPACARTAERGPQESSEP